MTKYKTSKYYTPTKIETVEIEKETTSFVSFVSRGSLIRVAKRGAYVNYFDTWEEAKQFLLDQAQCKADSLRLQLDMATGKVDHIKELKPPEETP